MQRAALVFRSDSAVMRSERANPFTAGLHVSRTHNKSYVNKNSWSDRNVDSERKIREM